MFWQSVRVLEIADKLGSVLSALIGLVGLVLTVYGLRLQRRATRAASLPPMPTALAESDQAQLEVPERTDWVPPSKYLPPAGWSGEQMMRGEPPSSASPRRMVLVTGLVLLAVAVVLGAASWLW
ncbi:hypothetical protein [Saccharopolyspora pogona]|uniref:hypothetical protein n=1 Tax=Saccharopolyspora pogona TaxID=333966 RepID=UPI0016832383|nr:hypothetical protein [Saccharopolyspora pogona]